tara:strand:+ start:987 stop:1172 length:186 start_codon:yes stop_codon:yes gene_type:complete
MTKPEIKITREDMELWAESHREAIDALMWFIEKDYTKEDLIESVREFVNELEGDNPIGESG